MDMVSGCRPSRDLLKFRHHISMTVSQHDRHGHGIRRRTVYVHVALHLIKGPLSTGRLGLLHGGIRERRCV